MTKTKRKPVSLHLRAHAYATRAQLQAPDCWTKEEKGTYWWGLYDGYRAGVKYGRRYP